MIVPNGTHAANPFSARANKQSGPAPVSMGDSPGKWNSTDARGLAIKLPMMVAGWGYDIFGRPVPSKASGLSTLNAQPNMGYYGFSNTHSGDARGSPPGYGAEVPVQDFVGGILDVRYNQRHGVWQTDHSFFAKITDVFRINPDPTRKYIFEYQWEEVEVTYNATKGQNSGDPFNRSLSNPASGRAVNVAELVGNANDAQFSYIKPGSVVEIKSYLVPKTGDGEYTLEPVYLFNQQTDGTVFLRVHWNSTEGYPAPLSNEDASYGAGNFNMCNRFLYKAEVMKWEGGSNLSNAQGKAPFGQLVSFSTPVFVQCINISELGNPVGIRGVVAPGVITATGGITASTTRNTQWTGSSIPTGANSTYPSGFMIKPIWHNTVVEGRRMHGMLNAGLDSSGPLYYFQASNAHDGNCATGIWPAFNVVADSLAGEHTTVKRSG